MCGACALEDHPLRERIRQIDRDLELRWNGKRERYEVWKFVRRTGKHYLEFPIPQGALGDWVLRELARRDLRRVFSSSWGPQIEIELRDHDEAFRRESARRFSDFHYNEGGPRLWKALKKDGVL